MQIIPNGVSLPATPPPGSSAANLCGFITKSRKYNFLSYTVESDKLQQSLQFSPPISSAFYVILSITVYIVITPIVTDHVFLCSKCHIWDYSANPFDSGWRTLFSVTVFNGVTYIARPDFDSPGVQGSAFFISTVDVPWIPLQEKPQVGRVSHYTEMC